MRGGDRTGGEMSTFGSSEQEQGQTADMYEVTVPGDGDPRIYIGIIRCAEPAERAEPGGPAGVAGPAGLEGPRRVPDLPAGVVRRRDRRRRREGTAGVRGLPG